MGDPYNRAPEKGKVYHIGGRGQVIYTGCDMETYNDIQEYDGIKAGKEFYGEDFSQKLSGNPEYISTIYWEPTLKFDENGKAEASFYTSDITGRFRVVVNGVSGDNVFYTTTNFDVK